MARRTSHGDDPYEGKNPDLWGSEFNLGNLGLGTVFKGIGNFIELVSRMVEEGRQDYTRIGEIKGPGEKGLRGVYGFSVKIGSSGLPRVEDFGNIRHGPKGPTIDKTREPLIDVFNEEDHILVIAELPGVKASDIKVEFSGSILTISATGLRNDYYKEVIIPEQVLWDKKKTTCKDGILKIELRKLRKAQSSDPKGD